LYSSLHNKKLQECGDENGRKLEKEKGKKNGKCKRGYGNK
jgi:hypothetical protein